MKRTLVLAAIIAASLVSQGAAAQGTPAPSATAPTVTLTTDQFAALVAKTVAGPAAPVPVVVTPPATISSEGVLGFSWAQLAAGLGTIALLVFGLFKQAGAAKAKEMVIAAAEGAWHIAERAGAIYGLDGATKGALALEAFIEAMGGKTTKDQVDVARQLWKGQSAKEGLKTDVAVVSSPPAKDLAAATAAADTSAKLAGGATATDLLKQAGQ